MDQKEDFEELSKQNGKSFEFTFLQGDSKVRVIIPESERVLSEAFSSYFKLNHDYGSLGISFCLESPISEISSKTLRIIKDIAAIRKDEFRILDGDGYMYYIYPMVNTTLHRVSQIKKSEIEKDFTWSIIFWGLVCLLFYYLIWYFLAYRNSQLNLFHRVQLILILLFYACFLSFWQASTAYYNYEEQRSSRAHELDVLERRSLKKLHFSYEELRPILPLEKDVIYHLRQENVSYFLQEGDRELLGKRLLEEKSQDKGEIFWLGICFFVLNICLYVLLWDYSKFYLKASRIIQDNFENMHQRSLDPKLFDDLNVLRDYLIEVYKSLKDRRNRQTFLSKKIYHSLAGKASEEEMEQFHSKEVFTLYLKLNDIELIERMASKNYFSKQNYMIQVIRNIASRQGGELFYEGQYVFCLFFLHARKSVSIQRAIISAMNIVKDLEKDGLDMKAYIYSENLTYSLAQTVNNKELIIQSDFMKKAGLIDSEQNGVFVESKESTLLDDAIFEKKPCGDYVQVLSVKDIQNHLVLLSSGSVELQKSVLDLVSLKKDDVVFESIL
ncbi:hypothetical protein MJH12_06865, partial [bacterium]|nr:hypothetical protein [bacterium]